MKLLSALGLFVALFISSVQAAAPTIVSITNSQRPTQGQSLSLSVSVNGAAPFTYQWKKDGTAISGATASTYTVASLALTDSGSYTVTITDTNSTATTSNAILIDVQAATAPYFYYQPSNYSVTSGNSMNLYASVSGTSPITYVWKKDGVTIDGATSYSYSKANVTSADAGSYTVTATNIAGSVTSSAFTVTVVAPTAPTFSSQPYDRTVSVGDYFSYWGDADSTISVTYQWYKDGVAIPGATSYYFSRYATASDAGSYTVVATNSVGSVTSRAGVVTIRPAVAPSSVSISTGPITVTIGESFNLYVSNTDGTAPLTYQWKKDGVAISGATSSSYSKSNVTADDTGTYSLVVTNSVGSATSSGTSVSVTNAQVPIITSHPPSRTVYPGDYVNMSVSATGTGTLSYQWKKDGVAISGATSYYYYVSSSITSADAGVYTVTVSNSQGSVTSQPATITVLAATLPTITYQPASVTVQPGQSINLSVSATGRPYPTYQWKKDGVAISGATSSSYYKYNVASSDAGEYTVVVSNSAGSVTSAAATVSIGSGTAPVITSHPASGSYLAGDSIYLSVQLQNSDGTTVQWYHDDVAISGATSSYYYLSAQPAAAGRYHAVVSNSVSSATSQDAVVTVDLSSARPVIIYAQGSQAVYGGNSTYVSINVAPNLSNYSVVWKKDGAAIPNANSLSYGINSFGLSSEGTYTAEVTTTAGTFTSQPIVMTLLNKGVTPRFTRNPSTQVRNVGDYVSFEVSVDGEYPITYQWRKGGVDIPGATGSYYSVSNLTTATAGDYTVVATNRNGSATSAVATLTVTSSAATGVPIISVHPVSGTYTAGSSMSVSVSLLTSDAGVTYQWYKDGTAISGATNYYLYYYSTATADRAGRYKVVVTNSAGSVTSEEAIVTITQRATGPTFSTQPTSQTGYTGGSITFTAAVSNTSGVTYQWRKDGNPISGATSASLTLSGLKTSDAGNYTLLATNSDGTTASAPATLSVTTAVAPTITTQPQSQVSGRTGSVTFSVTASGSPAPTYQWRLDGNNLSGANSATLSLTNLTTNQAGTYTVSVSNIAGTILSSGANLVVYDQLPSAPSFTAQPASRNYTASDTATLTVAVAGFPTPALQWYRSGSAISGATGTTLNLGKMTSALAGDYYAIATNDLGSARSQTATLTYSGSAYAGTYFGTLSTGESWALRVREDGTGTFLGLLNGDGKIIFLEDVTVASDGSFTFKPAGSISSSSVRAESGLSASATNPLASRYFTGTISGRITSGSLSAQIAGSSTTLSGSVVTGSSTANVAGEYSAVPLGSGLAEIHALAAPDGSVVLVEVSTAGVRGGRGTVTSAGAFTVTQSQYSYTGTLASGSTTLTGTYTPTGGTPVVIAADPSTGNGLDRLANVSTRGVAGKDSATMIAGFVVTGNAAKDVLIRAVGPTLVSYGVSGTLANPRLRLYKAGTAILENDDWSLGGAATQISSAAVRVGAQPLLSGSADAAILAHLDPGVYSAHVTSDDSSTGVVLMEVYDASTAAQNAPKVVNLSARATVGRGDDIMIVGFVVEGNVPKKVLIRGVGPALIPYGVNGALLDPKLRLYKSGTALAENDNWSSGSDASALADAAKTVGAQPLTDGSKDAAILLYLAPGVYSAHVSGVGDTTGIALIEVYEVP